VIVEPLTLFVFLILVLIFGTIVVSILGTLITGLFTIIGFTLRFPFIAAGIALLIYLVHTGQVVLPPL
jgi:hypothetical protein